MVEYSNLFSLFPPENLKSLITSAKEHNVIFIYALSPGLDMVFSSSKEVDILKKKMKQVIEIQNSLIVRTSHKTLIHYWYLQPSQKWLFIYN